MTVTAPPRPPRPKDPADLEALEALIEEARRRARRRRCWYSAAVLLAAGAAAGAFFGFGNGGSDTTQRVIPWKAERPAAPAPPHLAPPCRFDQLSGSISFQGMSSTLFAGIVSVVNVGPSACSLVGVPRLRVVGQPTQKVIFRTRPILGDDPFNRPPRSSLRAFRPGRRARFQITWRTSCEAATAIDVVLRASAAPLRLPVRERTIAGVCSDVYLNNNPSELTVSPWVPATVQPTWRPPLRAELIGPSHRQGVGREVVYRARRGTVLRYAIALTNLSTKPFTFARCPIYVQTITLERSDIYVLNCDNADPIPPRARAVFAMRIRIPATARVGNTGFDWRFPRSANGISASAKLIVTD